MLALARFAPILALVVTLNGAPTAWAQNTPTTEDEKTIYALGVAFADRNLTPLDLNAKELEILEAGIRDGVQGNESQVDLEVYLPKIPELAKTRGAKAAAVEKEASKPFLEKERNAEGATVTASGMIKRTLTEGSGESPDATSTVKVHYHGTLRDGTVFDSSVDRGEPVEFPLNRVIPCWTEGLQTMKVGEKARLVCPSDIAYGDEGRPPKIKPGAPLAFEVELIEIVR